MLVLDVPSGSPAEAAGLRGTTRSTRGLLQLGDVIIKMDDTPVKDEKDLFKFLEGKAVGDKVRVTVIRTEVKTTEPSDGVAAVDGVERFEKELTVTLKEKVESPTLTSDIKRDTSS